jgi:hypothetical protein
MLGRFLEMNFDMLPDYTTRVFLALVICISLLLIAMSIRVAFEFLGPSNAERAAQDFMDDLSEISDDDMSSTDIRPIAKDCKACSSTCKDMIDTITRSTQTVTEVIEFQPPSFCQCELPLATSGLNNAVYYETDSSDESYHPPSPDDEDSNADDIITDTIWVRARPPRLRRVNVNDPTPVYDLTGDDKEE